MAAQRENNYDALTGLLEMHSFFHVTIGIADRDHEQGIFPARYAVYFNISNFKLYNSIYGIEGGDECLKKIAAILKDVFAGDYIGRAAGDSFLVLAAKGTAIARTEEACRRINEMINNPGIQIRAGINQTESDDYGKYVQKGDSFTFDLAKIACDSIKDKNNVCYAFYTKEMGKYNEDRNFILAHFEEALKNGNIKIAYQPIVRSITGKFCNSEALSRWYDPEYGNISPAVFIKVLEDAHLIHKLDTFVLREVAKVLRYEIDHDIPYVPISINFSRLDFFLMNPFEEVQKVVKEFDLKPNMIDIEITESTILEDESFLKKEVNDFRNAGYEVWLDDFGSGYSSLNVLADFHFDEIKLDMGFLKNYSESSQRVIKSVIVMAKQLGLHTLAEGVETKEQADFLISIGCDKMQGYYYAKPMGLDIAVDYPQQRQINVETPEEEILFNRASAVNVITDKSIGFYIYDGKYLTIRFANNAYWHVLSKIGLHSKEEVNALLRDPTVNKLESIYDLAEKAKNTGKGSLIYQTDIYYMNINMQKLSQAGNMVLLQLELENLNLRHTNVDLTKYAREIRNFMAMYRDIYYFKGDLGEIEVLQSGNPAYKAGEVMKWEKDVFENYAKDRIHPQDQKRYLHFMNKETIYSLAEKSDKDETVTMFKEKDRNGNYKWMIYDAIVIRDTRGNDVLLAIREDVLPWMADGSEVLQEYTRDISEKK